MEGLFKILERALLLRHSRVHVLIDAVVGIQRVIVGPLVVIQAAHHVSVYAQPHTLAKHTPHVATLVPCMEQFPFLD